VRPRVRPSFSSQQRNQPDHRCLYASESYIVNNNIAKIMSVSYGECELAWVAAIRIRNCGAGYSRA